MKINYYHAFQWLFLTGLGFLLSHCAGSRQKNTVEHWEPPPPIVAAGVDSTVAAEADSLANELFVTWQRQEAAQRLTRKGKAAVAENDSLWHLLTLSRDSFVVSQKDSLRSIHTFNHGARQLLKMKDIQNSSKLNAEEIEQQLAIRLDSAQYYFEKALQLNPFDRNSRLWLARVYQMQGERLMRTRQLTKAATTLERLLRLDRSQHVFYGRLGQIYFTLKQWDRAYQNFHLAEETLKKSAIFEVPEQTPLSDSAIARQVDSTSLFLYVYYQGETNIRRYQSQRAIADFQRALPLAKSSADQALITDAINWINWDDGNIHSAEFRDSMLTLIEKGEYETASRGFRALRKLLHSRKAKREIEWRLSLLEYTHLGKPEQALNRLQKIVHYYLDDTTGIALQDTMYREYYKSYGTICYNQGLQALKERKLRRALAYFRQSCSIPWQHRAKSYLEVARLSRNSPPHALKAAKTALQSAEQLSSREHIDAMRILIESLKRMGKFDEAIAYFKQYREYISRGKNHE